MRLDGGLVRDPQRGEAARLPRIPRQLCDGAESTWPLPAATEQLSLRRRRLVEAQQGSRRRQQGHAAAGLRLPCGVPREHRGPAAGEVPERRAGGRRPPCARRQPSRHLLAAPHGVGTGRAGRRPGRRIAGLVRNLGDARLVRALPRQPAQLHSVRCHELRDRGWHRGSRRPPGRAIPRMADRPCRPRLLSQGAMTMGIRPIFSALLRNSAGAILVSLQIAITLAIVVNAVYLTYQRVTLVGRPSGIDDQNIFSFTVEGFEKDFDFIAMVREDMALLRQMPGIVDAAPMHQIPLSGSGSSSGYYSLPDKKGKDSPAAYFRTDEHGATALGVKLADGKNFDPSMIEWAKKDEQGQPPVAVVSRGFAEAL